MFVYSRSVVDEQGWGGGGMPRTLLAAFDVPSIVPHLMNG